MEKSSRLLQTKEEALQAVERILAQELLCHHDIDRLNKIHKTLGELEKGFELVTDRDKMTPTQKKVHELVENKIKRIRDVRKDEQTITSENVISLYHIREGISFIEFTPSGYTKRTFEDGLEVVKSGDIAADLPFC